MKARLRADTAKALTSELVSRTDSLLGLWNSHQTAGVKVALVSLQEVKGFGGGKGLSECCPVFVAGGSPIKSDWVCRVLRSGSGCVWLSAVCSYIQLNYISIRKLCSELK